MASDELKRRISLLQRGRSRRPRAPSDAPELEHADLAQHFPTGAIQTSERGQVFACEVGLGDIYTGAAGLVERYRGAFARAGELGNREELPRFLEPLAEADAEQTALIDTETAGLHGRPLFMIGVARLREGELRLTQLFARTYAEEAGLLEQFGAMLPEVGLLVSFNGKAFDWPFVRDRMIYHRIGCRPEFAHLDLLHPSRRRWRERLPDCKLQTLERYLSGRWRSGDIPGAEIPQRYHDFVREQDARLIAPIFHHTRLDLITMVELLIALVQGEGPISDDPSAGGGRPPAGRGRS
jgi:uncharacterized protein YprB with RNaseH-like and TPR domain